MVDDLDDSSELASLGTSVDEDDTADLDHAPAGGCDFDGFAHLDGCGKVSILFPGIFPYFCSAGGAGGH